MFMLNKLFESESESMSLPDKRKCKYQKRKLEM